MKLVHNYTGINPRHDHAHFHIAMIAISDFVFGVGRKFLDGVAGNRNTMIGVILYPPKNLAAIPGRKCPRSDYIYFY